MNIPKDASEEELTNDYTIRRGAVDHGVPLITNLQLAQRLAKASSNTQPTAVVYRTVKGWQYGIEGAKSHGAGHGFYSPEYLESLRPFEEKTGVSFPRFEGEKDAVKVEQAFYESLLTIRSALENNMALTRQLSDWIVNAKQRLAD